MKIVTPVPWRYIPKLVTLRTCAIVVVLSVSMMVTSCDSSDFSGEGGLSIEVSFLEEQKSNSGHRLDEVIDRVFCEIRQGPTLQWSGNLVTQGNVFEATITLAGSQLYDVDIVAFNSDIATFRGVAQVWIPKGETTSATVVLSSLPPVAPTELSAQPVNSSSNFLTWRDNSSNEAGFQIERRLNESADWSVVQTLDANSIEANDPVVPSTNYVYRVRAYNSGGSSEPTPEVWITSRNLNDPSGLTAIGIGESEVRLTWQDNSINEDGFLIERTPVGTEDWMLLRGTGPNEQELIDNSCARSTGYHYRVKASNGQGHSDYTNVAWAQTFALNAPVITSVIATWTVGRQKKWDTFSVKLMEGFGS